MGHVLVIGAAGLDIKGRPHQVLDVGVDNPGRVRNSFGGVARNIAENLARLEIETVLLSVVGDDVTGDLILAQAAAAGVNVTHVLQVDDAGTGSYIAILDEEGDLKVAVSDYEIVERITAAYLQEQAVLFAGAELVVIDLNLSAEAIAQVAQLCEQYDLRLCVDPTSPAHAHKIRPYLGQVYLIAPNATETTVLCELEVPRHDFDGAINIAKHLVGMGVEIAILTLGDEGAVYADVTTSGHIEARKTHVLDSTGAGDALSAAVIFALVNDVALDEAMRLGVVAASLTLASRESVLPDLTPDLLYDHL